MNTCRNNRPYGLLLSVRIIMYFAIIMYLSRNYRQLGNFEMSPTISLRLTLIVNIIFL